MLSLKTRPNEYTAFFFSIGLSILFGLLASMLPAKAIFAIAFIPLLAFITWSFPALALLLLISLIFGLFPTSLVPIIPIGGGKIQPYDLALCCLFLIVVLKSIHNLSDIAKNIKPIAIPLSILVILFFLSIISAVGYFGTPSKQIFAETRHFLYWLVLPITTAIVTNNEKNYNFIINGIIVIGYLFSSALVFQHVTGIDVLGSGRVMQLVTLDKTSDIIRSTSPGIYFVVLSIYLLIARWLSKQLSGTLALLACIPLSLGVLVTFGRGVWIASAAGMIILASTFGTKAVFRLFVLGTLLSAIIFVGLIVVKPDTGQAVADRLFSVSAEVDSGSSADWRYQENRYAIDHLVRSPLVGVGIGGFAHPKFHPMMDDDLLRYVHNGYLYLAVKLGVFSFLVPLLLILRVLIHAKHGALISSLEHSYAKKSLFAVFFVPCITSFTQPEWMVFTGVAFFAFVLALFFSKPGSKACTHE